MDAFIKDSPRLLAKTFLQNWILDTVIQLYTVVYLLGV